MRATFENREKGGSVFGANIVVISETFSSVSMRRRFRFSPGRELFPLKLMLLEKAGAGWREPVFGKLGFQSAIKLTFQQNIIFCHPRWWVTSSLGRCLLLCCASFSARSVLGILNALLSTNSRNPFPIMNLESLYDLVLLIDGERFPCHRNILEFVSPTFARMLKSDAKENQNKELELVDVCGKHGMLLCNKSTGEDWIF